MSMERKLKPYNTEIGSRLRSSREAMRMSREEFAERVGITSRFCADIERGRVGMSLETLMNACTTLRISSDYLLWGYADPWELSLQNILADLDPRLHHDFMVSLESQLKLLQKASNPDDS